MDNLSQLALRSQTIFGGFHFLFFLISWPFVIGFLKDYHDKDRLTFNCVPKPSDFTRQRCYDNYTSAMSPLLTPLDFAGITYGALSFFWVSFSLTGATILLQIKRAKSEQRKRCQSRKFMRGFVCHVFIQFVVLGVMMGLFCSYQTLHFPVEYTCSQTNTTLTTFNRVAVNIICNDLRYKEKAKLNIAIIVIMAISIACCILTVIHLRVTGLTGDAFLEKLLGNICDDNAAGINLVETGVSTDGERSTEHHADVSNPTYIIERIRKIYKCREERLLPFPWCDDSFHLNDIFTRLKMVNKEKTRGTLTDEIINMTGIFRAHAECQKPRIVLIEGEPGVGKTTYSQKLAYDWATKQDEWDESFPTIEVLLFLRCHDIKSSIFEAINEQILPKDIRKEAREMFFKFLQENQSKVLLLLDGLDEVDPSELPMFLELFESKELSDCHLVITSRHEVGKKVRRYCDTLWEIVGFTKEDAKSFIRKYFRQNMQHLAEKLIGRLWPDNKDSDQSDPLGTLDGLTKNPLNTALLCVLFEDFNGVLPSNRTQLYTEFVLCVLSRYENKNGLSSSDDQIFKVYRKELSLLGSLALESLRKGESYFITLENRLKSSVVMKFGFLSIQAGGSRRNPSMRCGFFHKSFQEFFAGLYLAFQILDREVDCDSVVTDERYVEELNQVFLFMIGIVASQCEETAVSLLSSMTSHINLLFQRKDGKRNVGSYIKFDGQCISKYSICEENLQSRLVRTLGKQLDLSPLTVLDLRLCGLGADGAALLSQALKANSSLTNLYLRGNSIGADGASFLSQALTANSSLTNLYLRGNSIGADGASFLSQALKANSSLTNLDLRGNSIGADGASFLSQALKANSSLTNLYLRGNSIGADGASFLSQALKANSSLTNLDLRGNSIGDDGAFFLSQALKANSSLTNLDLIYNSIGADGASFLSQALTANSSLTNLDLRGNSIGADGASFLSQALKANSSLTNLDLRGNSIGADGASFLSQALKANSSLTNLYLSDNSIGDDGASFLSQALKANSSLTNLYLSDNSIGDDGASFLSQSLKANSSLTNLYLSGNSISPAGVACLSEALKINKTVKVYYS